MSSEIKIILDKILAEGRHILTYAESRTIMKLAGLPLNKMSFAKNLDECVTKANEIGYPVVLKIISKDVIHKSDSGGVKLGISSDGELRTVYNEMLTSVKNHYPSAEIEGFSIEEMVEGVELLIGTNTDDQFGKMIALGIGGIFVEIYKDVTFRLIPISEKDVRDMIEEIQGKKVLDGYRGLPKVDLLELCNFVINVSKIIEENKVIKEMDLNPVVATKEGLKAIDARIILG